MATPIRDSKGEPGSLDSGKTKLPPGFKDSTGSYHERNSRRNSMGVPAFGSYGDNIRRNSKSVPDFLGAVKTVPLSFQRESMSSYHVTANSRRNSIAIPSTRINEDALPNYLRASTGSCHDHCKYGIKHAQELHPRSPFTKRMTKTSSVERIGRPVYSSERKKTMAAKVRTPPDLVHSPEIPEMNKTEISMPSRKVSVSAKRDLLTSRNATKNEAKLHVKEDVPVKSKPAVVNSFSNSASSRGLNSRRNGDVKMVKKVWTPKAAAKKVLASPTASVSPKASAFRSLSLKVRKPRNVKVVSPLKDQNRMPKTEPMILEDVKDKEKAKPKRVGSVKSLEKRMPKQADDIKVQQDSADKSQEKIKSARFKVQEKIKPKQAESFKVLEKIKHEKANNFKLQENTELKRIGGSNVQENKRPEQADSFRVHMKTIPEKADDFKVQEKMKTEQSDDSKVQEKIKPEQADDLDVQENTNLERADGFEIQQKLKPDQADNFNVQENLKLEQTEYSMGQGKTLHVNEAETDIKLMESAPIIIQSSPPPSLKVLSEDSAENSQSLFSDEEELEESEYTSSDNEEDEEENEEEEDSVFENGETVSTNGVQTSNFKKGRATKFPEDKNEPAVKLKFRRGKVVELLSENNGPRRLKFRRGRLLGVDENGQALAGRKSFKKKAAADVESKSSGPNPENVVLKHQDVQEGKKDGKVLFNNVIEETASKLAETRKSKVKALVGAFESVISLQDNKPSE